MAKRKTKRDRIIAMAMEGHPPREIAEAMRIRSGTVYNVLSVARRRGADIPRFKSDNSDKIGKRYVRIEAGVLEALERLAGPLGLTGQQLGARILQKVAPHRKVVAVLLKETGDV